MDEATKKAVRHFIEMGVWSIVAGLCLWGSQYLTNNPGALGGAAFTGFIGMVGTALWAYARKRFEEEVNEN